MSTRFTLWCDTHEVAGPHIRRHHSGAFLQEEDAPRFFYGSDVDEASSDWGGFLIEHEFCDLRLLYEYRPSRLQEDAVREVFKPTHELMPDGSLREL